MSIPDLCARDAGPVRATGPCSALLRLVNVGVEPVSPVWHRRSLFSSFWRLYVVDRPGLHLIGPQGRLDYPVDRLTVIPGWCRFVFHAAPGVGHAYVHFNLPGLTSRLAQDCFPAPLALDAPDLVAGLQGLGRRLGAGLEPALALLEGQALAELTWCRLCAGLDAERRARLAAGVTGRLQPLLRHIEEHLAEPLEVAGLARQLGLGAAQLTRLFRRELGRSPVQHVLDRRCARAAEALQLGEATLDQIASQVGFPNRHYLTRIFTRRLGLPPARYRALHHFVSKGPPAPSGFPSLGRRASRPEGLRPPAP